MKHCSPTGRRNQGRPLKRLLDTWDRNGSTSGPTPWQIYDDDDDNDKLGIRTQKLWRNVTGRRIWVSVSSVRSQFRTAAIFEIGDVKENCKSSMATRSGGFVWWLYIIVKFVMILVRITGGDSVAISEEYQRWVILNLRRLEPGSVTIIPRPVPCYHSS
jgi:hypothetical protein